MNFILKGALRHLIPLAIFLIPILFLFHSGIFSGKVLNQHDVLQWRGGAKEALDYRQETGEEALWTNSMFSGMPAYLVSTQYWGDLLKHFQSAISLGIPRPYSLLFLAMVCFYLMLQTYKVNWMASVLGAISYGATTFVIIGVLAGHTSRIAAIAFLPLVIAGVRLVFDKKYVLGLVLTALGLAMEIRVNHLQITYYLALIILIFGISELVALIKNKDFAQLKIQIPILIVALVLGLGANFGKLQSILQYSKYSTRGASELKSNESGLEKEYAFEFSNGITEPLVLFIPNFMGGASNQELNSNSNLAKALRQNGVPRNQISQNIQSVPTYFGDQRLSAPYYIGAITFFLAVLGAFIVEKKHRNWLLGIIALGIILSWGENFKSFNYFLFDYLPGYNKFRSVTFTLIISIFGIAMLASLGLDTILKKGEIPKKKQFFIAIGITGGLALILALFSGIRSYGGAVDAQLVGQQIPSWYLDAIQLDREKLFKIDAFRAVFLVAIAGGLLWFFEKKKLGSQTTGLLLIGLLVFDLINVNKRYVKEESFQDNMVENYFQASPADQVILNQNDQGLRVLNLQGTFNESKTSYLHSSIGGYHGAKLGRYQELIERGIGPEISEMISDLQQGRPQFSNYHILNMLNTGFIKYGDAQNAVIANPMPNGHAWFVSSVESAEGALDELNKTIDINTKTTAVIDQSKFNLIGSSFATGSIQLVERNPKRMVYKSDNKSAGLAVFSEIYYPIGWNATINGEEAPILRANYVLRGLEIPAGENEIVFTFDPSHIKTGNIIMFISSVIILLGLAFVIFKSISSAPNETEVSS